MLATLRRSVGFGASPPKPAPTVAHTQEPPSPSTSTSKPTSSPSCPYMYLVLENSRGDVKAEYPIRKPIIKIGRLPTNDIRIYIDKVSRIHCEVRCSSDALHDDQNHSQHHSLATLHVLNPSGVRINGILVRKLDSGSDNSQRAFALRDGDLISIHRNVFRVRYPSIDDGKVSVSTTTAAVNGDDDDAKANSENVAPSSSPQKALRMSLVRAAVVDTPSKSDRNNISRSNASAVEDQRQGRIPFEPLNAQESQGGASGMTPSIRKQRRQSLVFSTPKRPVVSHNTPWTAEPTKRGYAGKAIVKSLPDASNWSDPVETKEADGNRVDEEVGQANQEDSVVVLEEMDCEEIGESEDSSTIERIDAESDNAPTQPSPTKQTERLTQSSSPKKPRRRSSFFGRAGVFANWNFGFYPDERKAARENEDSLGEDIDDAANDPSGLPEPRLDENGRPRLPRSLSSPGGLGYTSPPKRRVVSLRTATLLRQGQNAFEQRKLRSPTPSPTKPGSSGLRMSTTSFMSKIEEMRTTAVDPNDIKVDADDAGEEATKLCSSNVDDDDADEVDRSLSMADDEQRQEHASPIAALPSYGRTAKARKSDSLAVCETLEKSQRISKARASMPSKLVSIAFVEGRGACAELDVEQLKSQWLAEQAKNNDEIEVDASRTSEQNALESDTDSEFDGEDDDRGLMRDSDATALPLPSSGVDGGVKYGMLRYLVRDNADLTALVEAQAKEDEAKEKASEGTLSSPAKVIVSIDVMETSIAASPPPQVEDIDAGWQVVSPRRARWKANDTVATRRASESASSKQKEPRSETRGLSKRRITATPALASGPYIVQAREPDTVTYLQEAVEGADTASKATSHVPAQSHPAAQHATPRSSAKRGGSSPSRTVVPASTNDGDAEATRHGRVEGVDVSPSKRQRRRDTTDAMTVVSPSRTPRTAKQAALVALSSSPDKNVAVAAVPATPSPSKKVRPKRSVQSIRKLAQSSADEKIQKAELNEAETEGAKEKEQEEQEEETKVLMHPSSPTLAKTTRKKVARKAKKTVTKPSNSDEAANAEEAMVKTNASLSSKAPPLAPRRRALREVAQPESVAAISAMPASEPASVVVATTRSGRAVRKPVDLKQPATVVQSDPVRASERVSRSRARKAA